MRKEIIGNATLYLGDCREILPTLGQFDACVTDPPYGINADKGAAVGGTDGSGKYARQPKQYDGTWDSERPSKETMKKILAAGKTCIIWGGNYFADLLPQSGRWLFWDKLNSMPSYSDGELAWTSIPGVVVKKYTQCNNGLASLRDGERAHPTQKPVALMKWCLDMLPFRQSLIDPFMGSGTTGVAALQMKSSFVGIEREEQFFDAACKRIAEASKQESIF